GPRVLRQGSAAPRRAAGGRQRGLSARAGARGFVSPRGAPGRAPFDARRPRPILRGAAPHPHQLWLPARAARARAREHLARARRLLVAGDSMPERTYTESFKVAADQLVDAVGKLVHEGNVRRIVIAQDGRTVAEFPLTVGVVGVVFAPLLAAVGALAAV